MNFNVSKKDQALINLIVMRARLDKPKSFREGNDTLDLQMDITATHCNGCPLNLKMLSIADETTFYHDVWGIRRHIDRETGALKKHFLPKCSA